MTNNKKKSNKRKEPYLRFKKYLKDRQKEYYEKKSDKYIKEFGEWIPSKHSYYEDFVGSKQTFSYAPLEYDKIGREKDVYPLPISQNPIYSEKIPKNPIYHSDYQAELQERLKRDRAYQQKLKRLSESKNEDEKSNMTKINPNTESERYLTSIMDRKGTVYARFRRPKDDQEYSRKLVSEYIKKGRKDFSIKKLDNAFKKGLISKNQYESYKKTIFQHIKEKPKNVSSKVYELMLKNSYAAYKIDLIYDEHEKKIETGEIESYKITIHTVDDKPRVMLTSLDKSGSRKRSRVFKKSEQEFIYKESYRNPLDYLIKEKEKGKKRLPKPKEGYRWTDDEFPRYVKIEDYEKEIEPKVETYYQTMKDGTRRLVTRTKKPRKAAPKKLLEKKQTITEFNLEEGKIIKELKTKYNKDVRKAREKWNLYKLYVKKEQKCAKCGGIIISPRGGRRVCSKCGEVKGQIYDYGRPKEWGKEIVDYYGEVEEPYVESREFGEIAKESLKTGEVKLTKKEREKLKKLKEFKREDYIPKRGKMTTIDERAKKELKLIKQTHEEEIKIIKKEYEKKKSKIRTWEIKGGK